MGTLFVYMLKSAFCLAGFYLFYRVLLARETFHRFNRFALLGILLLSAVLPFVQLDVQGDAVVQEAMLTVEQLMSESDMAGQAGAEASVLWIKGLLLVYIVGVGAFVLRNAVSLLRLLVLLRSGNRERIDGHFNSQTTNGVTLVVHEREVAPFSWMSYIVISRADLTESGREILTHELAHIRNCHSVDLLLANLCVFLQWFNPAAWLLKQELLAVHEYEADETVLRMGVNARQYQLLLIKKAVGPRLYAMANSFNHCKLKKRIAMMTKEKSNRWARLKYLYVLPVATVAVTAFARPELSETVSKIENIEVTDFKKMPTTTDTVTPGVTVMDRETTKKLKGEPVFEVVEEMPEFPEGGMPAFMQYLAKNIKYPKAAHVAGTQGRVVVQFVVEKDGSIVEPSVMRSVDPLLDAEAIRVISAMPKWKPGTQKGQPVRVKFNVPVAFRLNKEKAIDVPAVNLNIPDGQKQPLVLIDGKVASKEVLEALNPNKIEHITVKKDDATKKTYGAEDNQSVIVVTLKKGKN